MKKRLVIKENFNPDNKKNCPFDVENLIFGDNFNKSLDNYTFPNNVKRIAFGYNFNKSLEKAKFPSTVEIIEFSDQFNQPVENMIWPENIKKIYFGHFFNHPITNIKFPNNLEEIIFGEKFNQSIENVIWPTNLKSITLGQSFNQNININDDVELCFTLINKDMALNLPNNLKKLKIIYLKEYLDNLPPGLEQLIVKQSWHFMNKDKKESITYFEKLKLPFTCQVSWPK